MFHFSSLPNIQMTSVIHQAHLQGIFLVEPPSTTVFPGKLLTVRENLFLKMRYSFRFHLYSVLHYENNYYILKTVSQLLRSWKIENSIYFQQFKGVILNDTILFTIFRVITFPNDSCPNLWYQAHELYCLYIIAH